MREFGEYINANTPVVILTANAISGASEEYLEKGFDEYLTKPIDADRLEALIGNLVPDEKKQAIDDVQNDIEDGTQTALSNTENEAQANLSNLEKESSGDLPYIDGVDWNLALYNLRGVRLLMEALRDFALMSEQDMATLKEKYERLAADDQAFSDFRINVHSMKSNAATIGAMPVAGLAKYLEYAARDMDMDTIHSLFAVFEREWLKLRRDVIEAFGFDEPGNSEDADKPQISNTELLSYLEYLLEAMEEADLDRADEIVAELDKYGFPAEQKTFLENIKISVLNIDENECRELVATWRNNL